MDLNGFDLDGLSTIWEASQGNEDLRKEIEKLLQDHIRNNKRVSREFIYLVCNVRNHAMGITFIPTSEGYNIHGRNITILKVITTEEILNNYSSKVDSNGEITVKILISNSDTIKEAELTFNTNSILTRENF
jgi:hypothetical protein